MQTAKFFFFDIGVKNTLCATRLLPEKSDLWGSSFEHFIAMELRAFLSYVLKDRLSLQFWRSTSQFEVDFVLGDEVAIEVKASANIKREHFRGLQALSDEKIFENYYLISNDPIPRTQAGIQCLHWRDFLAKLWRGEIITPRAPVV